MADIRERADKLEEILKASGIAKYSVNLTDSEKQELNVEHGKFKLFRTVFSGNVNVTVFEGAKMGSANGTDLTDEGLAKVVEDAKAAALSSPDDPCHDIAPKEASDCFVQGVTEPDFDRLYARMKELLDTVEAEYPKVQVMMQIGSFDRYDSIYRNSNGTEFRKQGGYYEYELEFSAHEGDQTTGIDFCYAVMADLETPLIELGQARRHLEDVQNSLNPTPLTGKFTGTMILTPQCLENFISMTIGNYVSGGVILEGTSLWLDKIGEQVADERITVKADPFDERIVLGERNTGDGFRTEPVTIIEKGVLKSHILSLYVSNKTGRPVTKNGCGDLVMDLGEGTLEDLVKDVEKGLIVGGFSGGQPGINGEFSGVAKNSFLVENGKIVGAVSETMINGNLGEMLQHVRGLSRETGNNGTSVFPYMAVDGIVISGK